MIIKVFKKNILFYNDIKLCKEYYFQKIKLKLNEAMDHLVYTITNGTWSLHDKTRWNWCTDWFGKCGYETIDYHNIILRTHEYNSNSFSIYWKINL